jgi:hypothetical protein
MVGFAFRDQKHFCGSVRQNRNDFNSLGMLFKLGEAPFSYRFDFVIKNEEIGTKYSLTNFDYLM